MDAIGQRLIYPVSPGGRRRYQREMRARPTR
jgi:hypothetical protein